MKRPVVGKKYRSRLFKDVDIYPTNITKVKGIEMVSIEAIVYFLPAVKVTATFKQFWDAAEENS